CVMSRTDLATYLASEQLDGQVLIPRDGESFEF
ncbi:MBL fold metallo-hydrolase, partial [Clostridioides difficile]